MALETHRIHSSLLRPPTLLGVERELFFAAASLLVPIVFYGNLSLRSIGLAALYIAVASFVCRRLTSADHNLVRLFLDGLQYHDHYDPLPRPGLAGRKPRGRRTTFP